MKYNQNDTVNFNAGSIKGSGVIVGQADIGNPVIGVSYIVMVLESDIKIPNGIYPYTHVVIPEVFFS